MLMVLISILTGIVEGITEWLPVSSTAHMMILNKLLPLLVSNDAARNEQFYKVYDVVIQLGAILAVVLFFWKRIWPFGKSKKPLGEGVLSYVKKDVFQLWVKILIACIPAAVIGILFDDLIDKLFYNPACISLALIIVGIAFIVVENLVKNKKPSMKKVRNITYKTALYIGLFQVIAAIFPGTSRSGATIIGALLLGVSRAAATEFTFCLAIPVMAGASLLKVIKYGMAYTFLEWAVLLIGFLTSFLVSVLVVRKLLDYIRSHDFKIFGIYRIILGVLIFVLFTFVLK
ncbi:MAG: undecaprenyl-diphosphate phosphatase [Erysipelotrichaceae bacterium]|nr:undecaprenyl-diphosphate phosphatase [Erysipelotrichaceae bacterium]